MTELVADMPAGTASKDADVPEVEELSPISLKTAAVAALAVGTAACGGGGSGSSGGGAIGGGGSSPPVVVKPGSDAAAARFLLQAGISASPATISAVRDQGYEPWLNAQMSARNDQTAAQYFTTNGYDAVNSNDYFFNSGLGDDMIWSQLLSGGNQVRKRVALALSEFMVVSLNGLDGLIWPSQAIGYYWDILNDNAFGNFRDLLEDITLSPAMGRYLNTLGNRKEDPATGRVPDENFGREVMQLFSIGLYELNIDGSLRTGSGGQPIETYTNDDVTGIAKAFTGYDLDYSGVQMFPNPNGSSWEIPAAALVQRPMTADPSRWRFPQSSSYHSDTEKSFLGTTIPAGTNATQSLRIALDTLFNHPNVGPFFGKQMIQRLTTSNPTPAYVQRVAQVFNNNGSGVRGDLRAVFRAILLDEEALSNATAGDFRYGKLREPILRFAQWGRTFGIRSTSGTWDIGNVSSSSNALSQAPLRSPSVFNHFRPTYVTPGSQTANAGLIAPEFQIVNESSVASYINFMEQSVEGRGFRMRDLTVDYAAEIAIAHDATALLDRLDLLLTGNQLSQTTRTTILDAMNAEAVTQSSDETTKLRRVLIGTFLLMVSNDYLVQK